MPALAAGTGNDAGLGRDAPDSRASANSLGLIESGRHQGTLTASNDENDWYSLSVSGVTGLGGRPVVHLILNSVPAPNNLVLELWHEDTDSGVGSSPDAAARAGDGVYSIHYSLPRGGYWQIHVGLDSDPEGFSGTYELVVELATETDGDPLVADDKDAGASPPTSNPSTAQLTGIPPGGAVVKGHIFQGDPTDNYRFTASTNTPIYAAVIYPAQTPLTLTLTSTTQSTTITPQASRTMTGTGAQGMHLIRFQSNSQTEWVVHVQRSSMLNDNTWGAAYTLFVGIGPGTVDGPDIPGTVDIEPGVMIGALADNTDESDHFRLNDVPAGTTIKVGAAPSDPDIDASRAQIDLTLLSASGAELRRVQMCGGAGSIIYTTGGTGTADYQVRVRERSTGSGGCGALLGGTGAFALTLDLFDQDETAAGGGDAPTTRTEAGTLPTSLLHEGFLDQWDVIDMYSLGSLPSGSVVRAAVSTDRTAFQMSLNLFGPTGQLVAAGGSENGVARLQSSIGTGGVHYIQIQKVAQSNPDLDVGSYFFYVTSNSNEAPTPVTLTDPDNLGVPDPDVGRNSATLTWTRAQDDDFNDYEIHYSTVPGFTPAASNKFQTITNRDTLTTTVTNLATDTIYEFLVVVHDKSALSATSNRVQARTDPADPGNLPPSLSDGKVSPTTGNSQTLFTFEVKYTDSENQAPQKKRVEIDGVEYEMSSTDTSYNDGSVYKFQTTLTQGNHEFRFEFNDGGNDVNHPTTGFHDGPTVTGSGNQPPTAQATANPQSGDAPLVVQFNVNANDPDGDSLSYVWDFDNSNGLQTESTTKNPSHTYNSRGTYTATVKVSDGKGATSTSSIQINVAGENNNPPTAQPTANPSSGASPLTVQFTANAQDTDGTISSYAWDFNNANGITVESTQQNPTHTYTSGGSFVVTLTVKDNKNAQATGSVTVTVNSGDNTPPSVIVQATPVRGTAPLKVNFTANAADADGDALTISWDFDMANGITSEATGAEVQHTYTVAGTFTAIATVKDPSQSSATASVTITVLGGSGGTDGAGVHIVAEPTEGNAPLTVNFDADTSGINAQAQTFNWDFGDNSTDGTVKTIAHRYEKAGTYEVILTVTDVNGIEYESTIVITVKSKKSPGVELVFALAAVLVVAFVVRRRLQGPAQ